MSHELQMAYQVSQLTTNRDPEADAIGEALDLGLFVVVMNCLAYCRYTDATLPGTTRFLAKTASHESAAFQTLAEAVAFCDQQNQDESATDCGETSFAVIGPDRTKLHPIQTRFVVVAIADFDDFPF